jgi:hypothetical protein
MTTLGRRLRTCALLLACSGALAFGGCGGSSPDQGQPGTDGGASADASGGVDANVGTDGNAGGFDANGPVLGDDGGADASGPTGGDAANAVDAEIPDGYPAPFAAPPQVVDYGGPVLQNPKLVPVFFSGDDPTFTAKLTDFVSNLGATPYFAAAVGEYGVSPATAHAPVQLTETAPPAIDDTAIQTWLKAKLNGDDPLWPSNDANTVYVLHYPAGTTVTLQGQTSCSAFGGYHGDVQLDAAHGSAYVAYAVIPRCASFGTLTGIDATTGAESHEIAESVTDPYPQDNPAYATADDAHFEWVRFLGGGEVGDMCAQFAGAFTKFAGFDYTVQRIWSNAHATAGQDPCRPELPGEVYFNASPVLPDAVVMSAGGQPVTMAGVNIPVGQSKTIAVQLFSEAPTSGPWTVSAVNAGTAYLGFSFDKTTGSNGDTLMLTITVNSAPTRRNESFVVKSSLGGQDNEWIGVVGNPVVSDGGADGGVADGGVGDDAGSDASVTDGSVEDAGIEDGGVDGAGD